MSEDDDDWAYGPDVFNSEPHPVLALMGDDEIRTRNQPPLAPDPLIPLEDA